MQKILTSYSLLWPEELSPETDALLLQTQANLPMINTWIFLWVNE